MLTVTPRWLPLELVQAILAEPRPKMWSARRSGGAGLVIEAPLFPGYAGAKLYLVRVREGQEVLPHTDDIRAQQDIVMLQPAERGGVITIEGLRWKLQPGDLLQFDSNKRRHWVSRVEGGMLIVLLIQRRPGPALAGLGAGRLR